MCMTNKQTKNCTLNFHFNKSLIALLVFTLLVNTNKKKICFNFSCAAACKSLFNFFLG